MLFKLSMRNVRASIKDYSIYFLTLSLGICIFYIFNSIESQTIMMDVSETQKAFFDALETLMSIISVFVSFILGFLVIYANNFLIKRRNKEFGIYMTLGISRNKISFMLFYETIIIGILSLIVGLFSGIFLSQILAGVTAELFSVDMREYEFVFSKEACIKTTLYFSIIYLMVMILNIIVVSRYKLISLINSNKRNEKIKGKNLIRSVLLFVISVISLSTAYKLILDNGLVDITSDKFKASILLGVIGTLLFFRALAGFLIKLTQSNKNYYLRNLNSFTLRQLNSKINTNYISITIICLMLFVSICTYSASVGIKTAMENTAKVQSPYDLTFAEYYDEENEYKEDKISEIIDIMGVNTLSYAKGYVEYNLYESPVKFKDLFKDTTDRLVKNQLQFMGDSTVPVIKLSDYNKLKKLQGKDNIYLEDKEVMLLTDIDKMKGPIEEYLESTDNIKIDDVNFKVKKTYEYQSIENALMGMNTAALIINDEYVDDYDVIKKFLSMNYKGDKIDTEKSIIEDVENQKKKLKDENKELGIQMSCVTKIMAIEASMASAGMYLYIGIYVGIIFLISSAAVLGLSQLSTATESIERYKTLKTLGVSSSMINKSIFVQVFLYFALPIILALVHSYYGIKVSNDVVSMFGEYDTLGSSFTTVISICIIYFVYFIGTYNGYKRIVNK